MKLKSNGNHTGAAFQTLIDQINIAYESKGIACITRKGIPGKYVKAPPPCPAGTKVTKEQLSSILTPTRTFIPESKAEPDYGGTLASGRAIFYDTKTTKRDRMDWDNLHAHQIEFLIRMARMNAIAGFLCEFSQYQEIYFLPIQIVLDTKTRSIHRKIFQDKLTPALRGQGAIIYDYLKALAQDMLIN